jgi:glycosyltransferase involved in cell wall biosynthesis
LDEVGFKKNDMKLLIVTQKVNKNDPILGFFHKWVEEFSKNFEKVIVVCLEEGNHSLPPNVEVLSLGKERGNSRFGYIFNFYKYIWRKRNEYDSVFVHMNPEYVVLGGFLWRMWNKKIGFWYVHRQVNLKLLIATLFSNIVFTSTPESFGIKSHKVNYVGHGIDPNKFGRISPNFSLPIRILHLGRITKIKNIDTVINAARQLVNQKVNVGEVLLAGRPVNQEDVRYKKYLMKLFSQIGIANKVKWDETGSDNGVFTSSTISVNATPNGGMDKAVLGSFVAGAPCFVSNTAFRGVLGEYWEVFSFPYRDFETLAKRIKSFLAMADNHKIVEEIGDRVRREYSVEKVIKKINESLLLRNI